MDSNFKQVISKALLKVEQILDSTRKPVLLDSTTPHSFEDKYTVAEFLTNSATSGIFTSLASMGVTHEKILVLVQWAQTRTVTLRLRAKETCEFLREESKDMEGAETVKQEKSFLGQVQTTTVKTMKKVIYFISLFTSEYEILAFVGTGSGQDEVLSLLKNTGSKEVRSTVKTLPYPAVFMSGTQAFGPHHEVNITTLLRNIDVDTDTASIHEHGYTSTFSINRESKSCYTPRRNECVGTFIEFVTFLLNWCSMVDQHFLGHVLNIQQPAGSQYYYKAALNAQVFEEASREIFVPVLPVAIQGEAGAEAEGGRLSITSPDSQGGEMAIRLVDPNLLLFRQQQTMQEVFSKLDQLFELPPPTTTTTTTTSATRNSKRRSAV